MIAARGTHRSRLALGLLLGLAAVAGPAPRRAASQAPDDGTRQMTMMAILATPGSREMDTRLRVVSTQLRKILPDHGFRLLDVKSKQLAGGQSISCDLGHGYRARTVLEDSSDDAGKILFRCEFTNGKEVEFSKEVRSPENQLFFYERTLKDGSRVLIGIGARAPLD
ncbi:hypothetical protein OJF2_04890 [Aquisphaera giovannonii]|uniref:Uncharacterized protein n=1 Tax=Aquisphaera giovannonii TaxID=406548 RepID=A0A5B9VWD3_9BACT|nr:hypothetical protein [Aquisphaera giovannonii]QEH32020.1 hypothetical protein OJF2_04890 [Aquisphaera giovannonii]